MSEPPEQRRVRYVHLVLESTERGLVVTSPQLPGWRAEVRSLHSLGRAVQQAFLEAQRLALAMWQRVPYVTPYGEEVATYEPPKRRRRSDVQPPQSWQNLGGGMWRSPAGREYHESTQHVQRVIAKRAQLGMSVAAPLTRGVN